MKPYLKNRRTEEVVRTMTRRLSAADSADFLQLQAAATAEIDDPSLYRGCGADEFAEALERGEIHGLYAKEHLCAACMVTIPRDTDAGLAADIGIPEGDRPTCAVIEGLVVDPDYRGNGASRELLKLCINRAVERLDARYVLAAVSPKNVPCILNLMSINGMRLKALRQKYGCKLRYILCYNRDDHRLFTIYERFDIRDVFGISKALAGHFEGIATFQSDGDTFLWVAK